MRGCKNAYPVSELCSACQEKDNPESVNKHHLYRATMRHAPYKSSEICLGYRAKLSEVRGEEAQKCGL